MTFYRLTCATYTYPYTTGVNKKYRMTTMVGIKTKECVKFGSERRASKDFFIGSKITQRIAKIDDTLAVAIDDTLAVAMAGLLSLMNYKQISDEGEAFGGGDYNEQGD